MWRYVVGGIAILLLGAAVWTFLSGSARTQPVLPPAAPRATAAEARGADAALPVAAPEATARTREEKRFDRYDKDRDDRITREEYLVSRRKAYAKLDTDGDGRLSFDEWAAKTTSKFATADADKSATMSRAEFASTAVKPAAKPRCACPPVPPEE